MFHKLKTIRTKKLQRLLQSIKVRNGQMITLQIQKGLQIYKRPTVDKLIKINNYNN